MNDVPRHSIRRFLYPTAFRKAGPDVGWEPSPADVVDRMIRMARVCSGDVVYDLGCGDGRIVIAAAKAGAHSVGFDLDERRIAESRDNALEAGVGDLARFRCGDLFEAEIGEATVLFLFLFPDVNLRLRPKLLRELRAGTRVVSYCHDMGRWEPDGTTGNIYLWIAPGNMSGTWEGTIENSSGRAPLRMTITQEFQRVSGPVFAGREVFQLRNAAMEGEELFFGDKDDRGGRTFSLHGVIKGDTVTGTMGAFPQEQSPFMARRIPSTGASLAQ